jgi:hypothetical protein
MTNKQYAERLGISRRTLYRKPWLIRQNRECELEYYATNLQALSYREALGQIKQAFAECTD